MARYSTQQKQAIVDRYLNSELSVREFADQESLSKSTLYTWSNKFNTHKDLLMKTPQDSSEQRFAFVLETATLSETEISQIC
jgi:transposase-like protein